MTYRRKNIWTWMNEARQGKCKKEAKTDRGQKHGHRPKTAKKGKSNKNNLQIPSLASNVLLS